MLRVLVTIVACFLSDALSLASVETMMNSSLHEGFEQIRQLASELDCDNAKNAKLPIPTETTWETLANLYVKTVGEDKSTIPPWSERASGFNVPVYVQQVPGKGRGVFAGIDISEGELLWEPRNVARFVDLSLFLHFLLSVPNDLVCDVIAWAYMDEFELPDCDTDWVMSLDLDEAALINYVDEEANIAYDESLCGDIAICDIAKDEEICEDGGEYDDDDSSEYDDYSE
jgi:hypothetical protein